MAWFSAVFQIVIHYYYFIAPFKNVRRQEANDLGFFLVTLDKKNQEIQSWTLFKESKTSRVHMRRLNNKLGKVQVLEFNWRWKIAFKNLKALTILKIINS